MWICFKFCTLLYFVLHFIDLRYYCSSIKFFSCSVIVLMSVKLSCFSLNVRGIRDLSKRKALFLFCTSLKRDVYFFQETHSCFKDETFWRNQWGGNVLFCHGTNRSAGVLILNTSLCLNLCVNLVLAFLLLK